MALRMPAFSKALFHSRIPSRIGLRNSNGTVFSIQNTIGFFGGDWAADGSAFCKSQRVI